MAVTWFGSPATGLPIELFVICRPGSTVVADPFMETARAAVATLLLLTRKLFAVAPAATPVRTDATAAGGFVATVVEAPGPKNIPNVVFSVPVVVVAVTIFRPVA